MTAPDGLNLRQAAVVAERFGVAVEQVRRDHFISHALAAIGTLRDQVVFFGGTALARSFLPHGRLSEDIDLIAIGERAEVANALTQALDRGLRATHGQLSWSQRLTSVRDTDPVTLRTDDGIAVRVQLLSAIGYPPWPTELVTLHQRYDDAPPAALRVPTRDAFAAWKTVAWMDRAAARDLWDLWALAGIDALTPAAARLFAMHGPTLAPPKPWMFRTAPSEQDWRDQLAGQTILTVTAQQALREVQRAWVTASEDTSQ
jgi:predicted nucleotidyltransferase component of viral defense system